MVVFSHRPKNLGRSSLRNTIIYTFKKMFCVQFITTQRNLALPKPDIHPSTMVLISIFLYVITLVLITFVYKVIWVPFRVQSMMRSQGITGPSYKIIHGSTKESFILKQAAMKGPMELSHDIFPHIQPHFHHWIKLYGINIHI